MFTRSIIRLTLASIIVVSALLLIASVTANAASPKIHAPDAVAVRYVATTGDDASNLCLDQLSPCATVQHAIDVANEDDEILIASGTYTDVHVRSRNDITTTGVVTQVAYLSKTLTIRGGYTLTNWLTPDLSINPTILDAQAQGRVFYITGNISATIEGLRLTNGTGILSDNYCEPFICYIPGGAIYAENATVELIDSTVDNNAGGYEGAAIFVADGQASLRHNVVMSNTAGGVTLFNSDGLINNNRIISNTASNGGGIMILSGTATLLHNDILSNTAFYAGGGGVCIAYGSIATVNNNVIRDNRAIAYGGGGVEVFDAQAVLRNNLIENNFVNSPWGYSSGGGVSVDATGRAELIENTIRNNVVSGSLWARGGGVDVDGNSSVTMTGNLIENNAASQGGGLSVARLSTATVANNLFVNNIGSSEIHLEGGEARLLHNTLAGNASSTVLYVTSYQDQWTPLTFSTAALTNTLIASYTVGVNVSQGNTVTLNSLLWHGTPITVSQTGTATVIVHNEIHGDPRFIDPAHDDYHLAFDSAAIDHGVDAGVYTDLDGNVRPIGAGFDIGAYEFTGGTRYVATTGDDASNLCLDQQSPCSTVQHAIDVANDGDQVLIASGLYTQSATLSKPVSLTGVNSDTTILHAVAGQRVLTVTGATISNSVVISGLTFTDGNATDGGGVYLDAPLMVLNARFISNTALQSGGGLYASDAVTLTNVAFISNTALQSGGGLYASEAVTLTNVKFISNTSFDGGGGIFASMADVAGGYFENNSTSGLDLGIGVYGAGGGIYAITLTLTDTQFVSNSAIFGGGASGFISRVSGGQFERNMALVQDGGGLFAGYLVMSNTLFVSNTAATWGGGAYVFDGAAIMGGRFESNQATSGGGIATAANSFSLTGTEFLHNSAVGYGGGAAIQANGARLVNALFAGNLSGFQGAALYLVGSGRADVIQTTIADRVRNSQTAILNLGTALHVTNTIIANHLIGIYGSNNYTGTTTFATEDYNLFYGNVTNTVGVTMGTHSLIGDPRFIDPAHSDYHLAFGSAAIDRGVDAGIYTDLDGNTRPQGAGFDIGAYEYQGPIYRAFLPVLRR